MYTSYLYFIDYAYDKFPPEGFTEEVFNKYSMKACNKIDIYTQNRLKKLEEIPEKIQNLECECILVLKKYDDLVTNIGNVKSVSNDGYQVQYAEIDNEKSTNNKEQEIFNLVTEYAHDYCFRGVNRG